MELGVRINIGFVVELVVLLHLLHRLDLFALVLVGSPPLLHDFLRALVGLRRPVVLLVLQVAEVLDDAPEHSMDFLPGKVEEQRRQTYVYSNFCFYRLANVWQTLRGPFSAVSKPSFAS